MFVFFFVQRCGRGKFRFRCAEALLGRMLVRCSRDARQMLEGCSEDAAAGRCWRHWPISLFSFDIVAGLGFGPSFSSSDFYRVLPSFSFVGGCCGSGTGPKRNRGALPIWNRVFLLFFFFFLGLHESFMSFVAFSWCHRVYFFSLSCPRVFTELVDR